MTVTIERRYCGPPESGNGGYVAGLLAGRVQPTSTRPAVTVRLSSPPPLERPLTVGGYGALVLLQDRSTTIATACPAAALDGTFPEAVDLETARAAQAGFPGLDSHPFPSCFVCGTDRPAPDGLGIYPGPLSDGSGRFAASWTPTESSVPHLWGALDCPGGWSSGLDERPMVLGTMTLQTLAVLPPVGAPTVVVAAPRGTQGRKFHCASALYAVDGRLLARAEATWLAIDPTTVRPRDG